MKIALSFLSRNFDYFKTMELINQSNADFIHVDVADGLFVNNITPYDKDMLDALKKSKKKKDVHLMTLHIEKFIEVFSYIKPEYITYSFDATTNHNKIIKCIKEKGCKVGVAIDPLTEIDALLPILKKVDLVLVLSILPGYGGQKFLASTPERIEKLIKLRKEKKLNFLINVDGGVNEESVRILKENLPDMVVAGSYVVKSMNYNERIAILKDKQK